MGLFYSELSGQQRLSAFCKISVPISTIITTSKVHPAVEVAVHNLFKMLDGQFSAQNGSAAAISVVAAPPGVTPEQNKWTAPEPSAKPPGKKLQISDNMTVAERLITCGAEIGGTAILVFLGCAGCIPWNNTDPDILKICITFGLAVMVAVQCFGHISGSHINPVVSVAAATLGEISLIQLAVYFTGQMIGALFGFGLIKLATPSDQLINDNVNGTLGLCSPGLAPGVSVPQGFLIEFLLCLLLTLVCCGVWDRRNSAHHDSVPLRFGLAISVLALAGAPYTGANMNPARSFAPALLNGDWQDHWIYWAAPLSAAFFGALLYKIVFAKEAEENQGHRAEAIPLNDKP